MNYLFVFSFLKDLWCFDVWFWRSVYGRLLEVRYWGLRMMYQICSVLWFGFVMWFVIVWYWFLWLFNVTVLAFWYCWIWRGYHFGCVVWNWFLACCFNISLCGFEIGDDFEIFNCVSSLQVWIKKWVFVVIWKWVSLRRREEREEEGNFILFYFTLLMIHVIYNFI